MNKKWLYSLLAGVILVLAFIYLSGSAGAPTTDLTAFAQCLTDSGAKFYGAFWCSHCQNQKTLFGDAAATLPYVECSAPDGNSALPVCQEAGVNSYPTWVYADGSREVGERTLEQLAAKTGCVLPS